MSLSSNVNDLAARIATEFNAVRSEPSSSTPTVKHEVKLGQAINKGQVVYVSSANGTNMIVSKASNDGEGTSSKTMGVLETSGILNDISNVITEGLLSGIDTSTANAGDPIWLGTNGNLIFGLSSKPIAPAHLVFVGIVTRVHAVNGEIFVKVQNGFETTELHDFSGTPATNGQIPIWSASLGMYVPGNVASGAIVSETAPSGASDGQFWLDSTTLTTYVRYDSSWVQAAPAGPIGPTGPEGPTGADGATGPQGPPGEANFNSFMLMGA